MVVDTVGKTKTKKIVLEVEVEVPEGVELGDVFGDVKYRVVDRRAELEDILRRARRKRARIVKPPRREEIYGERAGY